MADNRTMAQLLEAPTEGYEDAIVVPEINANNFKIKHGLLNLVQNKQFFGHDKEDPHAHIRYFNKSLYADVPELLEFGRLFPGNIVTNPKEDLKGITTRSGVAYQGPTIPSTSSSSPKVMNRDTEVTKDKVLPTNNGGTEDIHPPVVQTSEPVVAPVSAPMPNQRTSIPFPSRRSDERRREKANDQIEKFYEIFRDNEFRISFNGCLDPYAPKFASTLKTLSDTKRKLCEMARTPLNENCSAVILNKVTFLFSKHFSIVNHTFSLRIHKDYSPESRKELKLLKLNVKSSIDEPPEVELKDLPPHLEYAFLEGDDKLPIIIAKDLKDEEKEALIKWMTSRLRILLYKPIPFEKKLKRSEDTNLSLKLGEEAMYLFAKKMQARIMRDPFVPRIRCVVVTGQEAFDILKLATVDPPGYTTLPITPAKKIFDQEFNGLRSTRMSRRFVIP
ncbi:hypothetical protein Tco_0679680 [Tanacetum coccineum]|uniref:Reverse transcriptase domain-containing protein n=1 Tax=Tanacetum coccineum TaxID=301880 RepID=A0ABQ4XJS7_9ASTR